MQPIILSILPHFFAYDPHTNLLLRVSEKLARIIDDWGKGGLPHRAPAPAVRRLAAERFGPDTGGEVDLLLQLHSRLGAFRDGPHRIAPLFPAADLDGARKDLTFLRSLVLNVTDRCNLQCSYCAYGKGYCAIRRPQRAAMTAATALRAIDYFAAHSGKSAEVGYSFYGGEPLLRIPLIQTAIEHIERRERGVGRNGTFWLSLTTNGTIMPEAALAFFVKHEVGLTVSLDGPRSIHDRCRRSPAGRGSFDRVMRTLETIRRRAPRYFDRWVSFSVVLSDPLHLHEAGRFFNAGILEGVTADRFLVSFVDTQDAELGLLEEHRGPAREAGLETLTREYVEAFGRGDPGAAKLADAYFQGKMVNKIFGRRLALRGEAAPRANQCITGKRNLLVAADGSFYPCSSLEVGAFRIGSVATGLDLQAIGRQLENFERALAGRCEQCWAARLCRLCMANFRGAAGINEAKIEAACTRQRDSIRSLLELCCRRSLAGMALRGPLPAGDCRRLPDVLESQHALRSLERVGLLPRQAAAGFHGKGPIRRGPIRR